MGFFTINNEVGSSPVNITGKFALHKLNGDWVFYDTLIFAILDAVDGEHIECYADTFNSVNINTKAISINFNGFSILGGNSGLNISQIIQNTDDLRRVAILNLNEVRYIQIANCTNPNIFIDVNTVKDIVFGGSQNTRLNIENITYNANARFNTIFVKIKNLNSQTFSNTFCAGINLQNISDVQSSFKRVNVFVESAIHVVAGVLGTFLGFARSQSANLNVCNINVKNLFIREDNPSSYASFINNWIFDNKVNLIVTTIGSKSSPLFGNFFNALKPVKVNLTTNVDTLGAMPTTFANSKIVSTSATGNIFASIPANAQIENCKLITAAPTSIAGTGNLRVIGDVISNKPFGAGITPLIGTPIIDAAITA